MSPAPHADAPNVTEQAIDSRPLLALVLLAAVMLVYLPGLEGRFTFDDYPTIVDNPALDLSAVDLSALLDAAFSGAGTGPLARPLAMLSFAAQRTLGGLDPWPFKFTNLVIHALNALLVWALLLRLLPALAPRAPRQLAWLIAALWALHPINVTSVLYVVQRMTSLSASFMLLCLLLYTTCRERQVRSQPLPSAWPWACGALALLALLSKEVAVTLPFYVLLIESVLSGGRWHVLSPRARRALALAAAGLIGAGLWYFVHTLAAGYAGREFTLAQRLWSEARVMFVYLRLLLVPTPGAFTLFHDDLALSHGWLSPPSTLLATAGLVAVSVVAWGRRRAQPYLVFGWAWFMLGHALEGSVIPLEIMHEHRNYLPGLGIIAALSLALCEALADAPRAQLRRLCALVALAVLAAVTLSRAALWAEPRGLMESELRHHPQSPRLWYETGRLRIAAAGKDATLYAAGIVALEQAAALAPIKTLPLAALLKTAIEREDGAAIQRLLPVIIAQPRQTVGEEIFRDLVICQGYGRCRVDSATVQALAGALLARQDLSNPVRQRVLEWLAVFYARNLADPQAAITILEDLVTERPRDLSLKTRLAEAYVSAAQPARARALAREVQQALPWSSVFTQRRLLMRLGRLMADEQKQ